MAGEKSRIVVSQCVAGAAAGGTAGGTAAGAAGGMAAGATGGIALSTGGCAAGATGGMASAPAGAAGAIGGAAFKLPSGAMVGGASLSMIGIGAASTGVSALAARLRAAAARAFLMRCFSAWIPRSSSWVSGALGGPNGNPPTCANADDVEEDKIVAASKPATTIRIGTPRKTPTHSARRGYLTTAHWHKSMGCLAYFCACAKHRCTGSWLMRGCIRKW